MPQQNQDQNLENAAKNAESELQSVATSETQQPQPETQSESQSETQSKTQSESQSETQSKGESKGPSEPQSKGQSEGKSKVEDVSQAETKEGDYGQSYSQQRNYKKQSETWVNRKQEELDQEQQKQNPDQEYIRELRSQVDSLHKEIYENLVDKYDVPDELREFLPNDIPGLKSFLNTDKYKNLANALKAQNERQQPKENAPNPQGPPSNQPQSKPAPKRFEDLRDEDFNEFDNLF